MVKEKDSDQVEQQLPVENNVESLIRVIRGQQVMLDRFTEQGVAMLSGVLKSPTAVEANIRIMRAFVSMRHFRVNNVAFYLFNEKVPSGRNATWNLTYYFLFSLKNSSKKSICF